MGMRAPGRSDYPAETHPRRLLEVARELTVPGLLPDELPVLPQLPRPLVAKILAIAREDDDALPAERPARELDLDGVLAADRGLLGMAILGLVAELLGVALLAPGVAVGALVVRDDRRLARARVAVDRGDLAVGGRRLHRERLVAREPPLLLLGNRLVAR